VCGLASYKPFDLKKSSHDSVKKIAWEAIIMIAC
jgi:hypothetical protein